MIKPVIKNVYFINSILNADSNKSFKNNPKITAGSVATTRLIKYLLDCLLLLIAFFIIEHMSLK